MRPTLIFSTLTAQACWWLRGSPSGYVVLALWVALGALELCRWALAQHERAAARERAEATTREQRELGAAPAARRQVCSVCAGPLVRA